MSRGLHLRGRGSALHPPRRVHRLWRVRTRVPRDRDLPGRGCAAAVHFLYREEQGSLQQRKPTGTTQALELSDPKRRTERSPGIVLLGRDPGAEMWKGCISCSGETSAASL